MSDVIVAAPSGEEIGAMRFTVFCDVGVKPGVVHIYHDDPSGNVNRLVDDAWLDPISGFPGFRGLLCAVEKANGKEAAK